MAYHKVGDSHPFLNVKPEDFARHMRLLARLRYRIVTLAEAAERRSVGNANDKLAVVTFDDGYVNIAEHAAPVLHALGWTATIYYPTAYAGTANEWDVKLGHPQSPIMDWKAIASLQSEGWEIGGHTHTHPMLNELNEETARDEIASGLKNIEDHLGKAPRTFCYPFGKYNASTVNIVREVGFTAACTVASGRIKPSTDPYELPRVKPAYRDSLIGFAYRLLLRPHLP